MNLALTYIDVVSATREQLATVLSQPLGAAPIYPHKALVTDFLCQLDQVLEFPTECRSELRNFATGIYTACAHHKCTPSELSTDVLLCALGAELDKAE